MKVYTIRTDKIMASETDLIQVLDRYIKAVRERSILAIASKIVAITQSRVVKKTTGEAKNKLIEREADLFLPPSSSKYPFYLTIKDGILIPNAGIDESNAAGRIILWPKNPQKVANDVRTYLKKKFGLKHVGVIITDSTTRPLRWGVTGIALAHSGFAALNNYVGKKDVFGRKLEVTKVNVADALASAATVAMGEGSEQTPLAIIEDVPFIRFQDRNPTQEELKNLRIGMEDDIFAPLLKTDKWQKS